MNMPAMRLSHYFLVLMFLPVLCSCGEVIAFKAVTASLTAASYGLFSDPDVNLKAKNYAAADFLVGQMGPKVRKNDYILAEPLEEVDHAGITSPLGIAIPEGIGLRFIELGYKAQLHKVASESNAGLYPQSDAAPDFVLKGTYKVESSDVTVYLRVINIRTKDVVARFDYKLLPSREVRELAQTPARIYRVSK